MGLDALLDLEILDVPEPRRYVQPLLVIAPNRPVRLPDMIEPDGDRGAMIRPRDRIDQALGEVPVGVKTRGHLMAVTHQLGGWWKGGVVACDGIAIDLAPGMVLPG
jgi:hypothetical protein